MNRPNHAVFAVALAGPWAVLLTAVLASFAVSPTLVFASEPYKLPPQDIVDLLDAPPPPVVLPSPQRDALLLVEAEAYPPIDLLARPFLKLGGLRVDPARGSRQRTLQYKGLAVENVADGTVRRVALPAGARIQLPVWSNDGKRFAFGRDLADGIELWVGDAATGAAHPIDGLRLNDVLGPAIDWASDNRHLHVRLVPRDRGPAPATPTVPAGPHVQETAGKRTRMATYQDLLETPFDEALFEHYGMTQLARVDVATGSISPIGEPGLYLDVDVSPNGAYWLLTRLERPFSYRVPYFYFSRSIEIWSADGALRATVAQLHVSDEVPPQGVPTGPRSAQWQQLAPATLVWAEALDGGDPKAQVPHRDRLMHVDVAAALGAAATSGVPMDLAATATEILQVEERFTRLAWTAKPSQVLISEYDRDRRWTTTAFVDCADAARSRRVLFDLSANDAYNDPGNPVWQVRPDGQATLLQDGDWIYLAGRGATEAGDRPFLDRMNLKTTKKERLFRSEEKALESFAGFAPGERRHILTARQSRTEPPNWYVLDTKSGERRKLTDYSDPAPRLTAVEKRLLKYRRADGTPLSGFLYLPPDYQPGTHLPVVVWAYPLEYSDAGTAGQVRGSTNTFTRITALSPLFFLLRGYAVLDDAAMPVVGDPETMNDTYVEQIVAAAKAAIDTLDAMGLADRDRACIGGHSYGAFMTANLLAHSDLFAAGIARSGAYNRSLTPFGFQTERRSYWEATDVYTRVSPFSHANKIDEPLLLIHGEEDNNSGTFPIQSERLFQAIQGNGGTARLVLLPLESHGYRARESVLDVVAEMLEWADRWVKNRPPRAPVQSRR